MPRTQDLVYYAAIGGVPHELLQAAPGDAECPAGTNQADCPQKNTFADADWTAMTGVDPEHDNFTGASPYMLESIVPRNTPTGCGPTSNDNCDPINGREWNTSNDNLQFACIFPLVDPATGMLAPKDCTSMAYQQACDCAAMSNTRQTPLCQKNGGLYTTQQISAKAFPSVRELEISHAMATASPSGVVQGIVSSLCPIHTSYAGGNTNDPLYGYRPAVNAIVSRLRNALVVK